MKNEYTVGESVGKRGVMKKRGVCAGANYGEIHRSKIPLLLKFHIAIICSLWDRFQKQDQFWNRHEKTKQKSPKTF